MQSCQYTFYDITYEVGSYLQISRSIGDVYLKKPEYNREPLHSKFRLRESFQKPILSSEPQITEHRIQPNDQFVIFASDGLWEHLSNQEAVDLVQSSPRNVCFLLLCYNFYELKSIFFSRLNTVPSNWVFDESILSYVVLLWDSISNSLRLKERI